MDIATLGWIPGGIAVILTLYAVYITGRASGKMQGDLKNSILFITGALIAYLAMGITIGVFSVMNILWDNPYWLILPIEALVGGLLFVIGARKLFLVLVNIK